MNVFLLGWSGGPFRLVARSLTSSVQAYAAYWPDVSPGGALLVDQYLTGLLAKKVTRKK